MSSLEDGFGGGVEDMLLRGITEETLFLAGHQGLVRKIHSVVHDLPDALDRPQWHTPT
jgi:hypothetical protein